MKHDAEFPFDRFRQTLPIVVVQTDIEWLQPTQDCSTYATSCDRSHMHSFNVVGTSHTICDIPSTLHNPLVGGDVVANERQDHHRGVF